MLLELGVGEGYSSVSQHQVIVAHRHDEPGIVLFEGFRHAAQQVAVLLNKVVAETREIIPAILIDRVGRFADWIDGEAATVVEYDSVSADQERSELWTGVVARDSGDAIVLVVAEQSQGIGADHVIDLGAIKEGKPSLFVGLHFADCEIAKLSRGLRCVFEQTKDLFCGELCFHCVHAPSVRIQCQWDDISIIIAIFG